MLLCRYENDLSPCSLLNTEEAPAPSQSFWYQFAQMRRPPQTEDDVPSSTTLSGIRYPLKQSGHEALLASSSEVSVDKTGKIRLDPGHNPAKEVSPRL